MMTVRAAPDEVKRRFASFLASKVSNLTRTAASELLTKLRFLATPRFRQTSERKCRTHLNGDPPAIPTEQQPRITIRRMASGNPGQATPARNFNATGLSGQQECSPLNSDAIISSI
jgi:hypothetical protein